MPGSDRVWQVWQVFWCKKSARNNGHDFHPFRQQESSSRDPFSMGIFIGGRFHLLAAGVDLMKLTDVELEKARAGYRADLKFQVIFGGFTFLFFGKPGGAGCCRHDFPHQVAATLDPLDFWWDKFFHLFQRSQVAMVCSDFGGGFLLERKILKNPVPFCRCLICKFVSCHGLQVRSTAQFAHVLPRLNPSVLWKCFSSRQWKRIFAHIYLSTYIPIIYCPIMFLIAVHGYWLDIKLFFFQINMSTAPRHLRDSNIWHNI